MKFCLVIFLLCCIVSPAQARPELKIIELQHRFALDLLPVLQPLAGDHGSVRAFGNQVIINAESADLANIEATIRSLDTPMRNWHITVDHDTQGRQQDRRIGVSGNAGNKNVKIKIPDAQSHTPHGVSIQADEKTRAWSQSKEMTLTVLDGAQAYITSGKLIPYTGYWVTLTQRYAHIAQTTDWQEVSTGFMVRPRQIGERVDIEIIPRLSQAGGNNSIDFTELSTHIQTRPGEWVDLGGLMSNRDEVSRAILSDGTSRDSGSSSFRIKVE